MGDGMETREVRVTIHGPLKRFLPDRREDFQMEVEEGSSVEDLITALNLPEEEVWKVSLNGELVDWNQNLSPGDEVLIMSPVAGG